MMQDFFENDPNYKKLRLRARRRGTKQWTHEAKSAQAMTTLLQQVDSTLEIVTVQKIIQGINIVHRFDIQLFFKQ